MTMSPPLPPSPPEGPPRGTNFSRRKAMQPLPPSPALTRIFASSINMDNQGTGSGVRDQSDRGSTSGVNFMLPSVQFTESGLQSVTTSHLGQFALFFGGFSRRAIVL